MSKNFCARIVIWIATVVTLASLVQASEPQAVAELTEFTSAAGKFSVLLPGKPMSQKVPIGENEVQHQFGVDSPNGAYIVSYQDNPNLKGSSPEQLAKALESGRERMLQIFKGDLLETQSTPLAKKHPGLSFRLTMPQAGGEANCRLYMVGTRLYQVMAIGKPDFVASEQSARVLDSFKLLQ
jgi:hypothetical protein